MLQSFQNTCSTENSLLDLYFSTLIFFLWFQEYNAIAKGIYGGLDACFFLLFFKAALSNTAIPRVHVATGASSDDQPEVDISDEEFLQFDTSAVPVIVTLTKVTFFSSSTMMEYDHLKILTVALD